MNQAIHFGRLWGSTLKGLRVYGLGGSYPIECDIPIEDGGPIVPLSSWRTRDRQYVLALSKYRWRIIQYAPGPPRVVVTQPAHRGMILGGWVDFKSKAFYCVEQLDKSGDRYPRILVTYDLDRTSEVKWVNTLFDDVSSEGGDVVFAGRLDGWRHIAVQVGLTKTAMVNVSDAWHPLPSGVIGDGGYGLAVEGGYLYLEAGQGNASWLEVYDVSLPQTPISKADIAIPGVWGGDHIGINAYRVGDNVNRIIGHNNRGDNADWVLVFDHHIPSESGGEHSLEIVAEHQLTTAWGDISVYTVDEQAGTVYLWGHPPGTGDLLRYHVVELDLMNPAAEPRIVGLPM